MLECSGGPVQACGTVPRKRNGNFIFYSLLGIDPIKTNNKLGASLKLPIFIFISGSFCGGLVVD